MRAKRHPLSPATPRKLDIERRTKRIRAQWDETTERERSCYPALAVEMPVWMGEVEEEEAA